MEEIHPMVVKPITCDEINIEQEMNILSTIDFVLPLKEEGICFKTVIKQVFKFYNPRRIIIVSKPDVLDRVSRL